MSEILVVQDGEAFSVTLTDGASVTEHEVRISPADLSLLGLQAFEPQALVEESFRFLLEREPKESILERFDLNTITRYFPDYPDEMRARMKGDLD